MTAGVPSVTVFVESRARRGDDGGCRIAESELSGRGWQSELREHAGLRLALRVDEGARRPEGARIEGSVVALPYYIGLPAMIRKLPALVSAVDEEVRRTDVVSVKLPGMIGLIAVSRARRHRKPIAVQVVGDVGDVLRSGVAGRPGVALAPIASSAMRRAVRKGDAVRYVTESVLQARYPPGADAEVVSFSDVRIEIPAGAARRAAVPGRVIAVGSEEQPYKGHHVLIEALARLARTRPHVHLVLVGGGRYQPQLKRLVQERDLVGRVRFTGHLEDRDELRRLLDSAEVFAMPSLTEGLPRALVEAMARGLPCVGSDVGGIPELLGKDALVPPDDVEALSRTVARVLDDEDFRERLAREARAIVERFRPDALEARRVEWSAAVGRLGTRSRDAR